MKVPCLFVAALCALGVAATDMDQKAKVIATVQTVGAGIAEVTCNDVGNWKFTVSSAQDAGRDVVCRERLRQSWQTVKNLLRNQCYWYGYSYS